MTDGKLKVSSDIHCFLHRQERLQIVVLHDVRGQSSEFSEIPGPRVYHYVPSNARRSENSHGRIRFLLMHALSADHSTIDH